MPDGTIQDWQIAQYNANVQIQYQQKGSRLRNTVTVMPQHSKTDYFDRLLPTAAVPILTRNADTPIIDQTHDRRAITMVDRDWGALVDRKDTLRMLTDPTGPYTINAGYAMGRALDTIIIAAATGNAYAGETGATVVPFSSGQQIAVDYVETGSAANSNLTIAKLRAAQALFGISEVYDTMSPEEMPTFVLSQSQMTSLLRTTEATNYFYNDVKALVSGYVNTFMGFNFVKTQLLAKSGNNRTCLAYPKFAIQVGEAESLFVQVDRVPLKRYSTLVYASGTFGASRMWETGVVSVLCDETT